MRREGEKERKTKKQTQLQRTMRVISREVGVGVGIKDGTCDGRRVMHGSDGSLSRTPETNITLHVNWLELNYNI